MTATATQPASEERSEPKKSSVIVRHQAWWWAAEDGAPPPVPGFVHSAFNPLVAAVADRCLSEHYGKPPEPPSDRQRTGLVLVSRGGDRVSAEHVRQTVADGRRVGPLYFFQSVPNSIAGYLTARWGLGGPVVCISPAGSPVADGLAEAAVLMSDGDADEVLLVIAEQGTGEGDSDCAHALLVGWPTEPVQPAGGRTA
jgi:3-oxoacyl-(acyl-carrier-protein) synthase